MLARAPQAAPGVFSGYASLFGVVDMGGDVVAPGAFRVSLAQRGAAGVRMLWQHDPAQPIGRWLSIAEDAKGLRVTGELNLEVARARELAALIRDGALDGLSIGFRTQRATKNVGGARRLVSVDLWEISLVTFPMLPGARVGEKGIRKSASTGNGMIGWRSAADRVLRSIERLQHVERRYSPEQPRDSRGRWASGSAAPAGVQFAGGFSE